MIRNGADWRLSSRQLSALAKHVADAHVHELGAGDGAMANLVAMMGARTVTLVDASYAPGALSLGKFNVVGSPYADYVPASPVDVALVCWPTVEATDGLVRLCEGAKTVIYIGRNSGTIECGSPEFWTHVRGRHLRVEERDTWNDLHIYERTGTIAAASSTE